MWRPGAGSGGAVILMVALVTTPAAEDRPLLLLETHLGKNLEKAERYLNQQAGLGYRLVSLHHLEVWDHEGSRPRREYRVVRGSGVGLGRLLTAAASEGFRVHPDAWIPLRPGLWDGKPRGAVVMERRIEGSAPCTYDVYPFDDLGGGGVRMRPGTTALALPLDGLVIESCGDAASGGEVILRTLDTTRWFRDQLRAFDKLAEQLTAAASEGCWPVWVRVAQRNSQGSAAPSVRAIIACEAAAGAQPLEFLVVPNQKSGLTDAPTEWAATQAALSKAAAEGFCLSSVVLGASHFLLQRRATEPARCEYRVVAETGSKLLDIIRLGMEQNFFPLLRRAPEEPIVLERRSPRE